MLPNAVDTARFGFSADARRRTRAALGLGEAFTVGCAARFDQQKNLPFLLALFAELRRREPDALLLLAGDGEEGPALRAEAGRLGIAETVRFLGAREDVPALLQAMDAFALPTRYEGFGIALLEAQAAGLPCFAPDGAVPREAAVTGLLRLLPPGLPPPDGRGKFSPRRGSREDAARKRSKPRAAAPKRRRGGWKPSMNAAARRGGGAFETASKPRLPLRDLPAPL